MAKVVGTLLPLLCLLVLVGLVGAVDRVDRYWAERNRTAQPRVRQPPPFRWSVTQCVDCGFDGDLVSLDSRCIYCHDKMFG